jgi:RND family efflux transporter MFP subunit
MKKNTIFTLISLLLAGSALTYYGLSQKKNSDQASANAGANQKNRPVTVDLITAVQQDYPIQLTATGVVSSLNNVEVRPQLSSVISKVHFKEGQFVKQGQLLFSLDERVARANLEKAQAQLQKEQASLQEFQRQLQRAKDLFDKKFQTQSVVDAVQTQVNAQMAVVATAKAAVSAAQVDISYTQIKAPSSGRTGLVNVFIGSLVQSNSTTPLVAITQMDPIAVTIPLPQRNLNDLLSGDKVMSVLAKLPESKQVFQGKMHFVDNVVDPVAGTIKVKASFENKEMKLWPGAYVNVDLNVRTIKAAIVIPQESIVLGAKANTVYTMDAEGKAQVKKVEVIYSSGLDAVVTGLDVGSRVVVGGKQNVRPGSVLKPRSENVENKETKGAQSLSNKTNLSVDTSANANAKVAASLPAMTSSASKVSVP